MTPLAAPLGGGDGLVAWRLDQRIHATTWDSGEGAFREGGRWNSKGVRAVYCALDPATAILEVAVHKSFKTLDTIPYVITAARILRYCRDLHRQPRRRAKPQLVAAGDSERRPTGLRRRSSSQPSLCGNSERGLDAQLEPDFRPGEGQRLLSPGTAGAVRARHALAPAGGLAVSFQEVVHSVWTVDADVAKPE